MKTVDVVIPVYKPDEKTKKLIARLHRQSYPVQRIILINTERSCFEEYFGGTGFLEQYGDLLIRHITAEEFDHGGTRRYGVSLSDADYFICMTDDAVPVDERLVEELLKPLLAGKAAASYARQLAGKEATVSERYSRYFNYPAKAVIKSKEDIPAMGIKTFFCSNVCAAYDRKVYERAGGFEPHMIFNEDMVNARHFLDLGEKIAYVPTARVLHFHRYTNLQQLKRNFDLGVSQAQFPEVFGGISSSSEGVRMMRRMAAYLLKTGQPLQIPGMIINSGFKYAGYQLGKHYRQLPKRLIPRLTMNPGYWRWQGRKSEEGTYNY
ncbi:MAG: glycosyltransferase family 2 protein [Lachnospiraceae bacterium]|nr:glycosyltransferase family 2 protein [Lachnospiraceae bacterium]